MKRWFLAAGLFAALLLAGTPLKAHAAISSSAGMISPSKSAAAGTEIQSPTRPLVYSLPPAKLKMARELYLWRTAIDFLYPLWSLCVLLAILLFGWAARLRDCANAWATKTSGGRRRPWLEGLYFLPLLLLLISLLSVPPAILAHHISLRYGQSIQGWASWSGDWAKGLAIDVLAGTLILSIVFAIIRASKRWWLWIWLLSLPAQIAVVFILPVVIDPLFNHFQPLSQTDPALVAQMEKVIGKTGISIPPSRIFLMDASAKVTSSNAYVTGFGSSKRVVVWDTTIKSSPTGEILYIFGHELGHYVLNHIQRGLVIASVLSFFGLWLGFHLAKLLLRYFGARSKIRSLEDWAAAALLLFVLSLLSFLSEPLYNAISRAQEHQADVFGQEIIHGIVADPQRTAAESFQRLGEQSLDYPYPNSFVVFWTFSHPPTAEREAFARDYNPWRDLPSGRTPLRGHSWLLPRLGAVVFGRRSASARGVAQASILRPGATDSMAPTQLE